jgi:hypothetical protein
MSAKQTDNTPEKQALKGACRSLVRAAGGVEAAEGFCRPNMRRLSEYGLPNNDVFMPVDAVADLEGDTHGTPNHPQVTRFLARNAGFALVRLPTVKAIGDDQLVAALSVASKEHGDVTTGLLDAMRDGNVSPEEAQALVLQCDESAEAVMRLRELLKQRAGEA